jgi:hypothetical protein
MRDGESAHHTVFSVLTPPMRNTQESCGPLPQFPLISYLQKLVRLLKLEHAWSVVRLLIDVHAPENRLSAVVPGSHRDIFLVERCAQTLSANVIKHE